MLKSQKSQEICSYCSRIFKDPIVLPCEDSISSKHLSERGVVKQNKIKCKKCNQEFRINDYEFRSDTNLKNSIERHLYLSEDEMSRKQDLEDSFQKFFENYNEFSVKLQLRQLQRQ
jgi:hypothetical protein